MFVITGYPVILFIYLFIYNNEKKGKIITMFILKHCEKSDF